MAICKFCGLAFAWGQKDDGGFVPLVPVGEDENLERSFQDENGVLRANHQDICTRRGGPTVKIVRLAKKVKGGDIIGKWTKPDEDGVVTRVDYLIP